MNRCLGNITPLLLIALASPPASAEPLFQESTEKLGSPQPCFDPENPEAEGCYTHYVVMADLDGDGDLDLVFAGGGGYYTPDGTAPFMAYLNDGSGGLTEVGATLSSGYAGRVRQVAVGDADGDGDLDLYLPQGYGDQGDGIRDALFINDGQSPPRFADESSTRLPIVSRAGATRFGDVDGDGDLDLVVTDWGDTPPKSPGTAHVYINDGAGKFAEREGAFPDDTSGIGTGPIDIDFADVDGDFDLDLVMASRSGDSLLFLNNGAGTFANAPLPAQPGPYVYGPDACDVDGDGDLDVWLDNGGEASVEQLLINDGTGKFSDETAERVSGNPGADDNEVQCVDVDGDGDFDAVIASLSGIERVLVNDGTGRFTLQEGVFPAISDATLGLDVGDLNGDRRLDVVTAQGEYGSFLNRVYLGTASLLEDTRAPTFRAVEVLPDGTPPGDVPVRFAVADAATSDIGPRLGEVYIELDGVAVEARFSGGDLFRAVLPAVASKKATYRACAVDVAGNKACSEGVTFTAGSESDPSGGAGGAVGMDGGGAGTGGGDAGAGGDGASGGGDDGCGCAIPGGPTRSGATLLGAFLALVGFAGQRSRARRRVRAAMCQPVAEGSDVGHEHRVQAR